MPYGRAARIEGHDGHDSGRAVVHDRGLKNTKREGSVMIVMCHCTASHNSRYAIHEGWSQVRMVWQADVVCRSTAPEAVQSKSKLKGASALAAPALAPQLQTSHPLPPFVSLYHISTHTQARQSTTSKNNNFIKHGCKSILQHTIRLLLSPICPSPTPPSAPPPRHLNQDWNTQHVHQTEHPGDSIAERKTA